MTSNSIETDVVRCQRCNGRPFAEQLARTADETYRALHLLLRSVVRDTVVCHSIDGLYKLLSEIIRGAAKRLGVVWSDLDDCVHDVWTKVLAALPRLALIDPNRLRAWFFRLVHNHAVDAVLRRTRHAQRSLDQAHSADAQPLDRQPDPSVLFDRQCRRDIVHVILARLRFHLPELTFRVMRLRFIEGLSVPEVARSLHIAPQEVWTRQYRGTKKFARLFRHVTGSHSDPDFAPKGWLD